MLFEGNPAGSDPLTELAGRVLAWGKAGDSPDAPGLKEFAENAGAAFLQKGSQGIHGLVRNPEKDVDVAVSGRDGVLLDREYRRLRQAVRGICGVDDGFKDLKVSEGGGWETRILKGCVHMYTGQMATLLLAFGQGESAQMPLNRQASSVRSHAKEKPAPASPGVFSMAGR